MASSRNNPAGLSPEAALRRALRKHYAAYLDDDPQSPTYGHNVALDEPKGKINPRGLTHATSEGYLLALCKCPRCKEVGSRDNRTAQANRLANRLAGHHDIARAVLARHLPLVGVDELDVGAQFVVSCHRVRNATKATVSYEPVPVAYALQAWALPELANAGDGFLDRLVADLLKELTS